MNAQHTPIRSHISWLTLIGLGCALWFMTGCGSTRNGELPNPVVESMPPAPTLGPGDFKIQDVSRIHRVNASLNFVIVEAQYDMAEGSSWKVMDGPRTVATLLIPGGDRSNHPFYVAEIVDGAPKIGNEVFPQ